MPKSKSRKKHKPSNESSGGGTMMSLRGGFKKVTAGSKSGPRTPVQKVMDVAFWILIIVALALFAFRRFR